VIVVSDASPLSALTSIGHLDLLRLLYTTVVVPPAVHAEVMAGPAAPAVARASSWLTVQAPSDTSLVTSLVGKLDEGEAEAITLALEVHADLLLIDERLGRREATRRGVRVIGVLGVLVEAKARSFIEALAPVLDDLVAGGSFRVAPELLARVLEVAGERGPE
jgi:hypothetical protein